MRQTIGFHATRFDVQPVQFELADETEPPEPGTEPAAMLVFESGGNMLLMVPVSRQDAEGMMSAFTQAEPMRQALPPEATTWQPEGVGLPGGMFWVINPQVIGMSVTPPQQTDDGLVPHWTLAFQDQDESQVQVAVSDAMCVQVVRALAQVAHGELQEGDGAVAAPDELEGS
ncbi:MAG TPA: hypothetical protein VKD47_05870 [Miltoncostaeaceae bacterium]|nr:hypothetical protein [Miltoncostaeaceae bacterium]